MTMLPHARASTPSRPSPIARLSNPRSPTKSSSKPDLSLSLSSIIGSTCSSSNRFSADYATSSFAYAAGAATVLATISADLSVKQRFFRAAAGQTVARPLVEGFASGGRAGTPVREEVRRLAGGGRGREGSPFTGSTPNHNAGVEAGDGSPITGHAKDRIKAATAVALSPGARWLAVGETGYRPRVLIFPVTDKKSTEQPVAIISEHTFGVQAVAWDQEGRLLATLGTVNDGYLFIWSVDESGRAALVASNKCTTIVKDMKWMGRSLITVGVRSVKIWRPDEIAPSMGVDGEKDGLSHPGHRPLVGRNTILGDMLDATFTSVVPLSHNRAALCSDAGDVCMLDDSDKQGKLARLSVESFGITGACSVSPDQLVVTGAGDELKNVDIGTVGRCNTPTERSSTPSSRRLERAPLHQIAVGLLAKLIITVDNRHNIHVYQKREDATTETAFTRMSSMASHAGAILGLRAMSSGAEGDAAFATWSSGGSIIGWSSAGKLIFQITAPLEQIDDSYEMTNELRTVAFFPGNQYAAAGDRYGCLRVLDVNTGHVKYDARAHSSEITDISIGKRGHDIYVATASRDRTIQVFFWKENNLELVQTLDEHAGVVTQLAFTEDGRQLLSCSADRTIVVREAVEGIDGEPMLFCIARTVTLKAAPTSMSFAAHTDQLIVTTADKLLCLVNYQSGRIISSFKAGDSEGGDPVTLSAVVHVSSGTGAGMVAGVSSADKSIRIYTEDGTLLARDWGHTEGVTDIALLNSPIDSTQRLVTVAADGTIFTWSTTVRKPQGSANKAEDAFASIASSSPLARPPLRKVISHSEISRLRRSMMSPVDDSEPSTPSGPKVGPPAVLRRKTSRLNVGVGQAPKLNPSTPRYATPTESSGTPTSRARSESPVRNLPSPTRSPQRSPERTPRRRPSQLDMAKEAQRLDVPCLKAATPSLVSEPRRQDAKTRNNSSSSSSSGGSSGEDEAAEDMSKRTEELVGALRSYRSALCGAQPRNLQSRAYSTLRGEIELLLRTMRLQEMASAERHGELSSATDYEVNGGASDLVDALQSVEERSEIF